MRSNEQVDGSGTLATRNPMLKGPSVAGLESRPEDCK